MCAYPTYNFLIRYPKHTYFLFGLNTSFSWNTLFVCLFVLIPYVPSTIFQLNMDRSSWAELSYDKCVLLKDPNAVTPVRLEPAAPRSWIKHSTTEPLPSHEKLWVCNFYTNI